MSEKIVQVSVPMLISDLQRLKQATGIEETKGAVTDAIQYRIHAGHQRKEVI